MIDGQAIAVADEALQRIGRAAFAQRFAQQADGSLQGRFGDMHIRPQVVHQFVFGNDPTGVLEEVGEQIKDLRLKVECTTPQTQRTPALVQFERAKPPNHAPPTPPTVRIDKKMISPR